MIKLNNKGKNFVTIIIVIAFCALLLRVAIENLIKINIAQNESQANATLKFTSLALEKYAKDNHGVYPENLSSLTQNKPQYLDKDYIAQSPFKGYQYACPRLEASGYSCSARPIKCKLTGKIIYTVTTGGLLISEECDKEGAR